MSSKYIYNKYTFNNSTNEWSFGLSNKWFLSHDLRDELINISIFREIK